MVTEAEQKLANVLLHTKSVKGQEIPKDIVMILYDALDSLLVDALARHKDRSDSRYSNNDPYIRPLLDEYLEIRKNYPKAYVKEYYETLIEFKKHVDLAFSASLIRYQQAMKEWSAVLNQLYGAQKSNNVKLIAQLEVKVAELEIPKNELFADFLQMKRIEMYVRPYPMAYQEWNSDSAIWTLGWMLRTSLAYGDQDEWVRVSVEGVYKKLFGTKNYSQEVTQ